MPSLRAPATTASRTSHLRAHPTGLYQSAPQQPRPRSVHRLVSVCPAAKKAAIMAGKSNQNGLKRSLTEYYGGGGAQGKTNGAQGTTQQWFANLKKRPRPVHRSAWVFPPANSITFASPPEKVSFFFPVWSPILLHLRCFCGILQYHIYDRL